MCVRRECGCGWKYRIFNKYAVQCAEEVGEERRRSSRLCLDHSRGRFFSAGRRKNMHMPPISILSADMRRMGGFDGITTCACVRSVTYVNMYVHR